MSGLREVANLILVLAPPLRPWHYISSCHCKTLQLVTCRVSTLSLTGRILYPWVDVSLVHWSALHAQYPKSILSHSFVVHQGADEDDSDKVRD